MHDSVISDDVILMLNVMGKTLCKYRNLLIVLLILCHSIFICTWNYFGFRLHSLSNNLQQTPVYLQPIVMYLADYVALSGSAQYWDFFAPTTSITQQSLIVCAANEFPEPGQQMQCPGTVLYGSDITDQFTAFNPLMSNQSRVYRFNEQLLGLDSVQAYDRFLEYWQHQSAITQSRYLFLIAQHRPVIDGAGTHQLSERIIWARQRE